MNKALGVLTVLLLVMVGATALAVDYWQGPPPDTWNRGDFGTTVQRWVFESTALGPPESYSNPYGEPVAEVTYGSFEWGVWDCSPELDPDGFVTGWHCNGDEGGVIVLHIPNTEIVDSIKWIFIQITSSKAPGSVTATGSGANPPYTSGTWSTGLPQIQWPGPAPFGGVWYTYNYGLHIRPNPQSEDIIIEVPYCTIIDQIVVDTICTPDPVATEDRSWSDIKALFR